ncbi:MAG: aminoglycoside phosphotransferase family protein [Dehalococcoidia bacterium]
MNGVSRLHPDQIEVDATILGRLLASQFPRWANLPVERFPSTGTENAIFRLGEDLAVRMPIHPGAVAPVEKEWLWLPWLAPHLPLAVPMPLAIGAPAEGYPWRWAVQPWLPGEPATPDRVGHSLEAARQLANFILALRRIDPTDGPPPGPANFHRGVPLVTREGAVRRALADLEALGELERIDLRAARAAWDSARAAPTWDGPPTWFHGDLLPGNLLTEDGRLTAVLDFEALGVGDPACDLVPAWAVFRGEARREFRAALDVDDAQWVRGRGWALSQGLIALPYYRETNPEFAALARQTIAEVLTNPVLTDPGAH